MCPPPLPRPDSAAPPALQGPTRERDVPAAGLAGLPKAGAGGLRPEGIALPGVRPTPLVVEGAMELRLCPGAGDGEDHRYRKEHRIEGQRAGEVAHPHELLHHAGMGRIQFPIHQRHVPLRSPIHSLAVLPARHVHDRGASHDRQAQARQQKESHALVV